MRERMELPSIILGDENLGRLVHVIIWSLVDIDLGCLHRRLGGLLVLYSYDSIFCWLCVYKKFDLRCTSP
jgi:hypothetical protein